MTRDATKQPEPSLPSPVDAIATRSRSIDRLFLAVVVLPTVLSLAYFGLLASDVYISESRFVVRSPERQVPTSLGTLLKGTGFSRAQDDSYLVQHFVLSRDALRVLDRELGLRKEFSNRALDVFSRFPGMDWDDSFEALHHYYRRKVTLDFDTASSISTLTTRAFSAELAFKMNEALLEMSEALVNQINERGRQDQIRHAAREVAEAEAAAKAAALALTSYRNVQGVIDPERQSSIQLQQIARLQDELSATEAQLAQLQSFTKDNPQIPFLQKKAQVLRSDVARETSRVAGGDSSLAKKAGEFQRLALEREYADKQLASAYVSLEQARNDAQRQQLYLERIAQPSSPDAPMEPQRVRSVIATVLLSLMAWGILTMLIAGVKEHMD